MSNEIGKTIAEVFESRYVIPLYQRNFAWRTDEVQQLLQDIYDAFEKKRDSNYYIGSLVVLKRHTGDYEVIDGQQRLTVISMLAILLGKLKSTVLSYDSRPEVQFYFEALCNNADAALQMTSASLFYLKEAYMYMREADVAKAKGLSRGKFLGVKGIADFVMNHVVLVRNEMPEDTDVASYFEIMNNRGEQLQKHELVKAKMLDRIRCANNSYDFAKQGLFAKLWDACAQMGVPIQRVFSPGERKEYFGDQCDGFRFKAAEPTECATKNGYENRFSIECILGKACCVSDAPLYVDDDGGEETDRYVYDSIIDFPNFLMHVFRLYQSVFLGSSVGVDGVPLNEKMLLDVYEQYQDQIDPMRFVRLLLFCRTVFDRFVVKTVDAINQEDGQKWVLIKPRSYENGKWQYVGSFTEDDKSGKLVLKAVSMLQVTFRTKIYKQWLFDVLQWFYEQLRPEQNGDCDFSKITADSYLSFLNNYILNYYKSLEVDISANAPYSKGTATPHFLLNFIDYLYWFDFTKNRRHQIVDFDFKYWNSVEHHLARNKVPQDCSYVDNLGNLCLISKSSNSRLSDRDVKEKVSGYGDGNMGPNRQIIYAKTASDKDKEKWVWGESEINEHYLEIVDLIKRRNEILKVDR